MTIDKEEIFLTNTECNPMHQCKFMDAWPTTLKFLASRVWGGIQINGVEHEVQTTFVTNPDDSVDQAIACGYLSTYDPVDFQNWLGAFCSKFVKEEVTKDWFENSPVNYVFKTRYQILIKAALTFPLGSNAVAPALHVTFVLGKAQ